MQDPSKNANSGTLTVGAEAKLYGDVYLFVTAGSTEWPVEVSIANAKQYAAQTGISLSKLIENFFDGISLRMEGEKQKENLYSPLVNELAGIISLPDEFDYKTDYENYLREKYE